MLLAIDIGNTHTVLGVFEQADTDPDPAGHWRIRTERDTTSDEIAITLDRLLAIHDVAAASIDSTILSSVVPSLASSWERAITAVTGCAALVVGPGLRTGMAIRSDNPHEVGADRIVNGVAAFRQFQTACIVIDMGTATTFDAISVDGAYLGGAIAPGLGIAIEALVERAARLASIELVVPERAIGTNTTTSMQSGALLGAISQIEGMLQRFRSEMSAPGCAAGADDGRHIPAVATGGLTELIAGHVAGLDSVDQHLTLRGLRAIALGIQA